MGDVLDLQAARKRKVGSDADPVAGCINCGDRYRRSERNEHSCRSNHPSNR